jgi:hypothetical protein
LPLARDDALDPGPVTHLTCPTKSIRQMGSSIHEWLHLGNGFAQTNAARPTVTVPSMIASRQSGLEFPLLREIEPQGNHCHFRDSMY